VISLFRSCFDASRDPTPACVLPLTIPLKTGDLIDGRPVSKAFAEAVLLYFLGYVRSIGFVRGSGHSSDGTAEHTQIVAQWVDPLSRTTYWAELHLQAKTFRTNATESEARRGFGLVGLGAALLHSASHVRETWTAQLLHMQTVPGLSSLAPASVGAIAASIAETLIAVDETKHDPKTTGEEAAGKPSERGDGWQVVVAAPDHVPPEVDDLKDRLLTADDFIDLLQHLSRDAASPSRFQGSQLRTLQGLIRRRKHTVLLGPPGVGKTVCAFEALALEQFRTRGVDFQLFMGHDDVRAADLLGAWQPTAAAGLFRWVSGPLVRAMTAHAGKGQPILVEEFLRMPRRSQNIFVTALSDGYLVLNEKPDENGKGELIEAGPDFVFLADMNVDAAADDLELYGAAFASRVRKLVFTYPTESVMLHVLTEALPVITPVIRVAIVGTYLRVLSRFESADVTCPMSPRACLQWGEEILAALPSPGLLADSLAVRTAAGAAAAMTWLTDVAGFDVRTQQPLLDDVEAQFRRAFGVRPATTAPAGSSRS
jgi:MoxR-like ATPase